MRFPFEKHENQVRYRGQSVTLTPCLLAVVTRPDTFRVTTRHFACFSRHSVTGCDGLVSGVVTGESSKGVTVKGWSTF
jgi:hypothetical protein